MSDGAISQDEIDALLSGVAIDGLNSSGHVGNGPTYHFDIPTLQGLADALKPKLEENINKTTSVTFTTENPVVEQTNRDHVLSKLPEVVIGINADYNAGVKGSHLYLMAPEFALKIFQLVSSEEATEVDDMVLSVVSEFVATHISAEIQEVESKGNASGLGYGTPETLNESKAMIMFPQGDFVLASYPLTYEGNAYTLWECIGGDAAEGLTKALGGGAADDAGLTPIDLGGMNAAAGGAQMGGAGMAAPMGGMQQMGGAMPNMGMGMQQPMGGMQQMGMGMPMGGMGMGMPQNMGVNMGMNVPNVQQLQYPNLQAGLNAGEQGNISLIMDVFMEMTVELGRTKKTIKDILGMGEGTIIELDKLAGEPVDILVNHKKIAKGEVVVIDENFGVRVTEILSPMERVTELN
jgi:flagellar motor switch protein FliN/FliY